MKIIVLKLILAINSEMVDFPPDVRRKITACMFYAKREVILNELEEIRSEYKRCKLKHLGKRVIFKRR